MRARSPFAVGRLVSLALVLVAPLVALPTAASAASQLDQWEPAQVVDDQPDDGGPAALVSTWKGRAALLYVAGGDTWGSSRYAGSNQPWAPPQLVQPAPDDGSGGPVVADPVAAGGGATVFLRSAFGEIDYTQLSPHRDWSAPRAFPYASRFVPDVALVQPRSGIVAIGAGRLGGQVRAAVKPQGERWRLSPALHLKGRKVVRGAWYGFSGSPHVLVARSDHGVREMYTVALREGPRGPRWGRLTHVPRGTHGGTLGALDEVSVVGGHSGEIVVLWHESHDGVLRQYLRRWQPGEGWSPTRRLPWPALDLPVAAILDWDGITRLAYVTASSEQDEPPYELVTRQLSADGALGDEEVLDTFAGEGVDLEAAAGRSGDLLLGWTTGTGTDAEVRLFRCLHRSGCVAVGSIAGTPELRLDVAPDGAALLAGVGDAVPGCPADALCTRRLPPPAA